MWTFLLVTRTYVKMKCIPSVVVPAVKIGTRNLHGDGMFSDLHKIKPNAVIMHLLAPATP